MPVIRCGASSIPTAFFQSATSLISPEDAPRLIRVPGRFQNSFFNQFTGDPGDAVPGQFSSGPAPHAKADRGPEHIQDGKRVAQMDVL